MVSRAYASTKSVMKLRSLLLCPERPGCVLPQAGHSRRTTYGRPTSRCIRCGCRHLGSRLVFGWAAWACWWERVKAGEDSRLSAQFPANAARTSSPILSSSLWKNFTLKARWPRIAGRPVTFGWRMNGGLPAELQSVASRILVAYRPGRVWELRLVG
jgi:hypothetical protein